MKKRISLLLSCIIFLVSWSSALASSALTMYGNVGQMCSGVYKPVEGAIVQAFVTGGDGLVGPTPPGRSAVLFSGVTDSNGDFSFDVNEQRNYQLDITYHGRLILQYAPANPGRRIPILIEQGSTTCTVSFPPEHNDPMFSVWLAFIVKS